jgi:hypothetical protein
MGQEYVHIINKIVKIVVRRNDKMNVFLFVYLQFKQNLNIKKL